MEKGIVTSLGGFVMTAVALQQNALTLHFGSVLRMNRHEFFQFCQANPELRLELTSRGDLIIMPPTGSKTGQRNFTLTTQFGMWMQSDESGVGFDSSAGFTLPNGAVRAPDLAWILKERWDALSADEQEEFAPICPDFVVELLSRTDRLETIQNKMREYIANGAQLGWLIDPKARNVYVYRPNEAVICLSDPKTISGDPLLPKFVCQVGKLWRDE